MTLDDAEALVQYANPMRKKLGLPPISVQDALLVGENLEAFQIRLEADRVRRSEKPR